MRFLARAAQWLRRTADLRAAARCGSGRERVDLDLLPIRDLGTYEPTAVDTYWGEHTVNSRPFRSAAESERYLEWRFAQYPRWREFMQLYGEPQGELILDYGCGPGDDLVGFLLYTRARKVIGIDVSPKALEFARRRLALHGIDPGRVELIRSTDNAVRLPCDDDSVDYVNCGGVLHHVSEPRAVLAELARVLRPGGRASVMVYNRDSIWLHLYTAYMKMIVEQAFPGMLLEEAFAKTTDGPHCPVSRCYAPREFLSLVETAGFAGEFVGGYLSLHELQCLDRFGPAALADARLATEHETFLRGLTFDPQGLPIHQGKHAGIGGVYRLRRE